MWYIINWFAVDGYCLKSLFGLTCSKASLLCSSLSYFSFSELESVNLGLAGKFVKGGPNFTGFAFVDRFDHGCIIGELLQV